MLDHFYKDLRYYSFDEYLDGQTFIHMIVLALQENRVPARWRFNDYGVFFRMVKKLKVIPDGHESSHAAMYGQHDDEANERDFMNWKKLMTMFVLLRTPMVYSSDIDDYSQELSSIANEKGEITKD